MLIIGIAGGTGSGKTTVVNKIISSLPQGEVTVIPQDSYYKDSSHIPPEERSKINFDEPASIEWTLLAEHLRQLKAGHAIEMPTYSYLTCTRQEETVKVEPRDVVIVEGILVLNDPTLRKMMDVKVFVDADADDRLIRVIARDCVERGRTPQIVIDRYQDVLKPMHEMYIEPTKRYADLIVPQGGSNAVAIGLLTDYIDARLRRAAEELNTGGTPDGRMVLRTDNLVKKYGKRTVANHVSIDVKQGEIVGLLGPNGAGKTTTFYMTVGLITPNEGRIFLNDVDITKYPVYKRARYGIGYLAQEPSVFRKMTVENNIRSVLEMTPTSKEYQRDKLESLIAEFRLEKVRKNLGDQLSGGERRRTEIARCLAIDPKFIMLDEPFAGVDPIAVEDIQYIVYKLKEKNIGILITDHNAPETLSITDRAYLLFDGRILFQGTSEELAVNPVVREKYLGRNFIFNRKKFD